MSMSQAMSLLTSKETVEWYTPAWITDRARLLMGRIDLDPATSSVPQTWIIANTWYTKEDNGLTLPWFGNVWLNPPFDDTKVWVERMMHAWPSGEIDQALMLVNSNAGYKWYESLWSAYPVCCLTERVCFVTEDGTIGGAAKRAQTIAYFGDNIEGFKRAFGDLGRIILPDGRLPGKKSKTMQKTPYAACNQCPLQNAAFVPPTTPTNPKYILIGEAPAAQEIVEGKPFVGKSGKLLRRSLDALDSTVENDAHVTNTVLCQSIDDTGRNVVPSDQSIACCALRLKHEIDTLSSGNQGEPLPIITLGNTSTKVMRALNRVKDTSGIETSRGVWIEGIEPRYTFLPTYHPAYVLRQPGKATALVNDLEKGIKGYQFSPLQKQPKVIEIKTFNELKNWCEYVPGNSIVAFDIETDGFQYFPTANYGADPILCLTMAVNPYEGVYINDMLLYDNPDVVPYLEGFFYRVKPVAHNGKFDCTYLAYQLGLRVDLYLDTMLATHELNTDAVLDLKIIAKERYNTSDYEGELVDTHKKAHADKRTGTSFVYSMIPEADLKVYAVYDTVVTYQLALDLLNELGDADLLHRPYLETIAPATRMYSRQEVKGISVDVPHLEVWGDAMLARIEELKSALLAIVGYDINLNSTQQVAEIIYDKLRFRQIEGMPKPKKTGPRSTGKVVLQQMNVKYQSEFITLLLEYRRIVKLHSNFIVGLLSRVSTDGRLHGTIKQLTETGRISIVDPPLQTLPRESTDIWGAAIRSAIIADPSPEGTPYEDQNVLVVADYSQAEIRAAIAFSFLVGDTPDEYALEILKDGRDIHGETCLAVFSDQIEGLNSEHPAWKHHRTYAKNSNFAWVYWGNAWAVAAQTGAPLDKLELVFRKHSSVFKGLNASRLAFWRLMQERGYVETITGRRRSFTYINEYNADEAKKASYNQPVQGSAADCTTHSAIELEEVHSIDVRLTVHDSIIAQCKRKDAPSVARIMGSVMIATATKFFPQVPWKVDIDEEFSERWVKAPALPERTGEVLA